MSFGGPRVRDGKQPERGDGTDPAPPSSPMVSSLDLLQRAQGGDSAALDLLYARVTPALRRWASGRLPGWARDLLDTEDLVQETVLQTLKHVARFEQLSSASQVRMAL